MPEVFGVSAGIEMGALGKAHQMIGQQLLSKTPNLLNLENLFCNLFGSKTCPDLALPGQQI